MLCYATSLRKWETEHKHSLYLWRTFEFKYSAVNCQLPSVKCWVMITCSTVELVLIPLCSSSIQALATHEATVWNLKKTILFLLEMATFWWIILSTHGTHYLIILSLHQWSHDFNIDLNHLISAWDIFTVLFLFSYIYGTYQCRILPASYVLLTCQIFSLWLSYLCISCHK